ncbi:MAG: lipase family protein [Candidatus Omnitrophica bacterium]|nr:lipase family protein [Candidatus Omnitrophota bacterium]
MYNFDNTTTRFSLLNALRLAEASSLVYDPLSAVESKVKNEWGFPKCELFDDHDTQAFMCSNETMIILAFRGSQTPEDWQTDFKVRLVASAFGRVHRGFNEGLDYIWGDVERILALFRDQNQKIWVTGHSLGAALAALAVDRLTEEEMDVSGLYTFGQPRVGDNKFADNFDDKIKYRSFRFVNDEDIVTRVPPRSLGYAHIGTVRYFDCHGDLYTDNIFWRKWLSYSESATVRSSDRFSELKSQYPNGLEDHSLNRYIKNIRKNYIKETGFKTYKDYLDSM